jgi:DNA-directed RNA polymerase specialized sigma subunit
MPKLQTKNAKPATRSMGRRRLKKYPPLTEEQKKLVQDHKWVAGRLAHSAKCITGGHTGMFTREDLESVAYFALCVAASRYTPGKGVKFSTYAWATAQGYIIHALRDYSRMVRLPRRVSGLRTKLRELLNSGMSYEQAAAELGIDQEWALLCEMSWKEIHASYDSQPEDWRERQFIYNEDEVKHLLADEEVLKVLRALSDKEMEVLLAYVDDQPIKPEEALQAQIKIDELRALVYGTPHREATSP